MSTKSVITKVASTTPLSPKRRVNSAVASDAARILTRLLPKSTEPIRRSLSSVIASAVSAPLSPLSARARNLPREAAVSAVSLPENRPESTKSSKIAATVIQNDVSKIKLVASIEGAVSLCFRAVYGGRCAHDQGAYLMRGRHHAAQLLLIRRFLYRSVG